MAEFRTTPETGDRTRWLPGLAAVLLLATASAGEPAIRPPDLTAPHADGVQSTNFSADVALASPEITKPRAMSDDRSPIVLPMLDPPAPAAPRFVAEPVAVTTHVDPAPDGFALVWTGLGILFLIYRFRSRLLR